MHISTWIQVSDRSTPTYFLFANRPKKVGIESDTVEFFQATSF
jgi:hypothetical protein